MSTSRTYLALALLAAMPVAVQAQVEEQREAGFDVRREWMEQLRAYPFGEYTQNPVYAARAAAFGAPARAASGAASSVQVAPWRSVGPFGFQTSGFYGSSPNADGGRIRTVAIHPTNPSIVYAGSASGGVWRTTNGGATWTPLTDNQCSLNTGSIAIDPVNPNIVYVGTGEPAQSNGCGLLRSFDGGTSWTEINGAGVLAPVNGSQNTRAYRIRVAPSLAGTQNTSVVLYAANNGLHRSTNSGSAWSTVLTGFVTDVEFDPANDNIVWAARAGAGTTANGVYRSTDRGATWLQVYATGTTVQRISLAVSPITPNSVWAVEVVSSRMDKLVRLDGASATPTVLTAQGVYGGQSRLDFGTQGTYDLVLEVDPQDANTVILGGSRMYRSRNGGQSFSLIAYDLHVDWHAFAHGGATTCRRELWFDEAGTTGDLIDLTIRCECGSKRRLIEAMDPEKRALGTCNGRRPWLGTGAPREACSEPSKLLNRQATNAYFGKTLSVLALPDRSAALSEAIEPHLPTLLNLVHTPASMVQARGIPGIALALTAFTDEEVLEEIDRRRGTQHGPSSSPVKFVELDALLAAPAGYDDTIPLDRNFHARMLPDGDWRPPGTGTASDMIERVVQVHRLREVVALLGFTRFEATSVDANDSSISIRRSELKDDFRVDRCVPLALRSNGSKRSAIVSDNVSWPPCDRPFAIAAAVSAKSPTH